jgi:hypothetical protein
MTSLLTERLPLHFSQPDQQTLSKTSLHQGMLSASKIESSRPPIFDYSQNIKFRMFRTSGSLNQEYAELTKPYSDHSKAGMRPSRIQAQ